MSVISEAIQEYLHQNHSYLIDSPSQHPQDCLSPSTTEGEPKALVERLTVSESEEDRWNYGHRRHTSSGSGNFPPPSPPPPLPPSAYGFVPPPLRSSSLTTQSIEVATTPPFPLIFPLPPPRASFDTSSLNSTDTLRREALIYFPSLDFPSDFNKPESTGLGSRWSGELPLIRATNGSKGRKNKILSWFKKHTWILAGVCLVALLVGLGVGVAMAARKHSAKDVVGAAGRNGTTGGENSTSLDAQAVGLQGNTFFSTSSSITGVAISVTSIRTTSSSKKPKSSHTSIVSSMAGTSQTKPAATRTSQAISSTSQNRSSASTPTKSLVSSSPSIKSSTTPILSTSFKTTTKRFTKTTRLISTSTTTTKFLGTTSIAGAIRCNTHSGRDCHHLTSLRSGERPR